MYIVFIFTNIIMPIFLQMAIGFAMQKKFSLNINTLAKIQFYVLIPALLFVKIYESKLSNGLFMKITLFCVLFFIVLYLASWAAVKIFKYPKSFGSAFTNSVCFYNSGNYCIPLIQLLYNSSFSISVQVIIMMVQNVITNTFGIVNTNTGKLSFKHALLEVVKIPMGYSVLAAILIKALKIEVWPPIWSTFNILGQGMVPIALFTLGAQLANTTFTFKIPRVYLSNFYRLILSPAIAWLMVIAFGLNGVAGQVLVISAAAPTAVNTVLLAIEYGNEPDFCSQSVFSSTVLSALTVSIVIFLAMRFI